MCKESNLSGQLHVNNYCNAIERMRVGGSCTLCNTFSLNVPFARFCSIIATERGLHSMASSTGKACGSLGRSTEHSKPHLGN